MLSKLTNALKAMDYPSKVEGAQRSDMVFKPSAPSSTKLLVEGSKRFRKSGDIPAATSSPKEGHSAEDLLFLQDVDGDELIRGMEEGIAKGGATPSSSYTFNEQLQMLIDSRKIYADSYGDNPPSDMARETGNGKSEWWPKINKKKVVILSGPVGIGKTTVMLNLKKRLGSERVKIIKEVIGEDPHLTGMVMGVYQDTLSRMHLEVGASVYYAEAFAKMVDMLRKKGSDAPPLVICDRSTLDVMFFTQMHESADTLPAIKHHMSYIRETLANIGYDTQFLFLLPDYGEYSKFQKRLRDRAEISESGVRDQPTAREAGMRKCEADYFTPDKYLDHCHSFHHASFVTRADQISLREDRSTEDVERIVYSYCMDGDFSRCGPSTDPFVMLLHETDTTKKLLRELDDGDDQTMSPTPDYSWESESSPVDRTDL